MKQFTFIFFCFIGLSLQAQLFGKKDLGISIGSMNFHASSLNNSVNTNHRISKVSELDKRFWIKRLMSAELGIGFGTLENLDNRFYTFESSQFFRIKTGVIFHLSQRHTPKNWSPKRINPYLKVGYKLDFFDYKFKQINEKSLGSSVAFGGGLVVKINHYIGLKYEFTHNQRITEDYRTFFQNDFGILINMDQIYLSK